MSHIVKIATEVRDIEALKAACKELGLDFAENQTTYRWFFDVMPNHKQVLEALEGMTDAERSQAGKCSHAIRLHGLSELEIGIVKTETGFRIACDDLLYRKDWNPHAQAIGAGCSKLLQLYGVHKAQIEAKKRGLLFTRKQVGTRIQCTVSGM